MAPPPEASTMKTTGRVTAVAALVAALTTPGAAQELVSWVDRPDRGSSVRRP